MGRFGRALRPLILLRFGRLLRIKLKTNWSAPWLAVSLRLLSMLASGLGLGGPALAQDSAGLCAKIVAHYKQLVANPPASAAGKFYPDSPLSMLGDAGDSGVSVAPHIAETGKAQRPLEWAQHQGLQLPADLQDALDKADFLDQLPDTNFYAASRIEGTAYCYDTTPFVVTGAPRKTREPAAQLDGRGCRLRLRRLPPVRQSRDGARRIRRGLRLFPCPHLDADGKPVEQGSFRSRLHRRFHLRAAFLAARHLQ